MASKGGGRTGPRKKSCSWVRRPGSPRPLVPCLDHSPEGWEGQSLPSAPMPVPTLGKNTHSPRDAASLHLVGHGDVSGPHVVLPAFLAEDAPQHGARVHPHSHVHPSLCLLPHIPARCPHKGGRVEPEPSQVANPPSVATGCPRLSHSLLGLQQGPEPTFNNLCVIWGETGARNRNSRDPLPRGTSDCVHPFPRPCSRHHRAPTTCRPCARCVCVEGTTARPRPPRVDRHEFQNFAQT